MRRPLLFAAGLVALFFAFRRKESPHQQPTVPTPGSATGLLPAEGLVSFYGPGFHGKQTANGEIFDQEAMTAAARKPVPFGTRLRVTDPTTGRSVVVRVNDRGPFTKNAAGNFAREIDLSMGAARQLNMIERGVIRVRIEVLS
jgi:rare lipoprotein A